MTVAEMGYNRKLVGLYGELYKYGEGLFGVYLQSKRIASKIARITGAVKRQDGDYETTYSVPELAYPAICTVLRIPKLATFKPD